MVNTQAPLVTVVMATYREDRLDFLRQAVESILGQTHTNLEFLIVLDGEVSVDTKQYLEDMARFDSRVRAIALAENRGAAHARNAGFREARGEYIAIMDADDTCAADRIEKQVNHIRRTGADVIGTFMNYIDDRNELIGKKDMVCSNEQIRRTALFLNPINNATVLAKSSIFRDHPYHEPYRRGHDYHLWARLIVAGYRLENFPEYLYNCRTGPDFLARRGKVYFAVVLRSLMLLVSTYPWCLRPFAAVAALALASLRLLPRWCLRIAYRMRNAFRARETPRGV